VLSDHSHAGSLDAASVVLDWKFCPKWDTLMDAPFSQLNGGLDSGSPPSVTCASADKHHSKLILHCTSIDVQAASAVTANAFVGIVPKTTAYAPPAPLSMAAAGNASAVSSPFRFPLTDGHVMSRKRAGRTLDAAFMRKTGFRARHFISAAPMKY
jgi:hypothetical protein